ncbi:MAG TPA: serine hydrolase domain-containing protein [Streptosporangiaceae bacterium]|nr:serine hydrolase domain-containing protein [Streptosporangiaceae bacterium]
MTDGERLEEIVETAVARGDAPGVVAAVSRGDEGYVAAAGVMAVGGPPMRPDTLFRIASITKPVTAAVVLSLAEDGLVGLEEPVDRLLPELADRRVLRRPDGPLTDTIEAERAVTTRDLLTFTWGFGMQGAMFMAPEPWPIVSAVAERELSSFGPPQPDTTPEPDTFMARLGELPLLAQPGERWLYSAGSQVLGVLAARAAGAPFEDVMRERVLAPLGMDDTAFYANDTSRLATSYENVNGELTVRDRPDGQWSRPPRFPDGAAGLVSTAEDLLRFGRMLLLPGGNPVLTAGTVAEMTSDQLTPAQLARVWPGFSFLGDRGWGYGVSVTEWGYSWEGGSGTAWANVPDQDLTVVVLTQRTADETGLPAVCDEVRTAMSS